ncbi:unnamed protein product [Symbiodinium sp. CCMP2592]|nr:unnamed protein product [Symbiodinium sp. CCMP2592]
MPTKRPVPLSDAALGHKGDASSELAIGETNAGVPLPVKNTFIDMPSGLTPVNSPSKDAHPSSTAPAQVHLREGWIDRAIDRGVLDAVQETVDSPANVPTDPGVPGLASTSSAQRPGGLVAWGSVCRVGVPGELWTGVGGCNKLYLIQFSVRMYKEQPLESEICKLRLMADLT